jgi:hypothetical protein
MFPMEPIWWQHVDPAGQTITEENLPNQSHPMAIGAAVEADEAGTANRRGSIHLDVHDPVDERTGLPFGLAT